MSLLVGYVQRLVTLWKERANLIDDIKEARRDGRQSSVDRLVAERKLVDDDIDKVLREAKQHGFDTRAVEIVAREAMETPDERDKRREFELVLDVYRKEMAK